MHYLVTGHTGFKGAWLSLLLRDLGAQVHGLALEPETDPALFHLLRLGDLVEHRTVDMTDGAAVAARMREVAPDVVFHLAAQPLVRRSYREPAETWSANVMGTIHLLEAVRTIGGVRAVVIITSDKCYEDLGDGLARSEAAALGGHDPYSSSKAATELAVTSWRRSFLHLPPMATVRAGNVIGGGDWGEDRLVPDLIRAIAGDRPLVLRRPMAVRPWQHVLDPLVAYVELAERLAGPAGAPWAESWNVGPDADGLVNVGHVATRLVKALGRGRITIDTEGMHPHETAILRLDTAKAAQRLGWLPAWDLGTTLERTAAWYRAQAEGGDARELCRADLAAHPRIPELTP